MNDYIFSVGLPVLAVFLIGILVIMGARSIKKQKSGTVRATVVSKKTKIPRNSHLPDGYTLKIDGLENYVTFRMEGDEEAEFYVNAEIFADIEEGDEGILTYDRHYFISFEKNG